MNYLFPYPPSGQVLEQLNDLLDTIPTNRQLNREETEVFRSIADLYRDHVSPFAKSVKSRFAIPKFLHSVAYAGLYYKSGLLIHKIYLVAVGHVDKMYDSPLGYSQLTLEPCQVVELGGLTLGIAFGYSAIYLAQTSMDKHGNCALKVKEVQDKISSIYEGDKRMEKVFEQVMTSKRRWLC